MWAARRMKFLVTVIHVSLRRSDIMGREEERPLFMMWTVVRLSEWIRMDLLVHSEPQRWAATTMGYSSKSADEMGSSGRKDSSSGHSAANHFPP